MDAAYEGLRSDVRQVVADFAVEFPHSTVRQRQVKAARVLGLTLRRLLGWWQGDVKLVEWTEGKDLERRIAEWRARQADRNAAAAQLDRQRTRFHSAPPGFVARLAPPQTSREKADRGRKTPRSSPRS